ncbi:deoxyribodipyrimidine photo-lyase [Rhizobium sp. L1K21]|uniref:cryptochrome/photolyase family protein n=1 Tax=Rhizobium sp. L1K21 TaxID=2954933 RepID=UPI002092B039|nr:deoxyribodipyrimidine photo-lyase [Rhizobium sp. L1K21]MCO6186223.1 DNA photolyase family protein [Rhizobium sp. L1K21]
MSDKTPTVVLLRRDLRLADNPALHEAMQRCQPIVIVYIREKDDPDAGALGAAQDWWLHHSLAALGKSIEKTGNRLILKSGDQNAIVGKLVKETGATAVYWNRRYHKAGRERDAVLKETLRSRDIEAISFGANLLHEPSRLKTTTGGFYRVYTPFWKAFSAEAPMGGPHPAPGKIPAPERYPESEDLKSWSLLPEKPNWAADFSGYWTPGESGASQALEDFLDGTIRKYKDGRDFPAKDRTSRLSPHLALGEISPLQIWHAVSSLKSQDSDTQKFLQELVWREFCWHLLFHFPDLKSAEFNDRFKGFAWDFDEKAFDRWTKGQTGYPIVDAGMRQLWQTGWMHNRVRMIVASFLIKDLMIDWRHGEAWFRDTLVDADPASNTASWQWVAGSGADAAPYFRIFNPVLQGEKFDPDGDYVRRFVPEIAKLPNKYLHKPFAAPKSVLSDAGLKLGKDYPEPIVDHAKARDRALEAFQATKD